MFKAKILCGRCGRVIAIYGRVWQFRLRHSKKDEKGHYLGWNCDRCADAIERGGDYY